MEITSSKAHDKFVKGLIADKGRAKEILSYGLPIRLNTELKWEELRREHGSFIDEKQRELHSDALFSVPYKGKGGV